MRHRRTSRALIDCLVAGVSVVLVRYLLGSTLGTFVAGIVGASSYVVIVSLIRMAIDLVFGVLVFLSLLG